MKHTFTHSILLGVALGLVLGLNIFVVFKVVLLERSVEELSSALTIAGIQVSPKQSIETPIDTSTWKTYRNEEHLYEIKHPADWEVVIYDQKKQNGAVNASIGIKMHSNPNDYLSINVQSNSSGTSLDKIASGEKILIDGVPGIISGPSFIPIAADSIMGFDEHSLRTSVIFIKDNLIYSLIGESRGTQDFELAHKTISKMISTFMFVVSRNQ